MSYPTYDLTFAQLQERIAPWVKRNFGDRPSWQSLLGVQEEVGELSHAHLKEVQRIRGTAEEHQANAKDAVADIVIFLADYCSARDWDMQAIVEATLSEVLKRDWVKARGEPTP